MSTITTRSGTTANQRALLRFLLFAALSIAACLALFILDMFLSWIVAFVLTPVACLVLAVLAAALFMKYTNRKNR